MMFAKIKDNKIVVFPYGYDDLQKDLSHKVLTGNIDILNFFTETESFLKEGCRVVSVIPEEKPREPIGDMEIATLSEEPILNSGKWVLTWNYQLMLPDGRIVDSTDFVFNNI